MKIIEDAIKNGELHLFLIGKGDYKCHGRSDYPDPTDFLACWEEEIIPYFNKNNAIESAMEFYNAIKKLFNYTDDVDLGLYSIATHVFLYHSFESENKLQFKLDWLSIAKELQSAIELNKKNSLWIHVGQVQSGIAVKDYTNLLTAFLQKCWFTRRNVSPSRSKIPKLHLCTITKQL